MPNLATGPFMIAPMSATSEGTLADLLETMKATKPKHATFASGWGSVDDDPTWLKRADFAPAAGSPYIVEGFRSYPDVLVARLYWFKPASQSRFWFAESPTPAQKHTLMAVDVLISPKAGGGFMVMVTSRDYRENNKFVIPVLRALFTAVDEDSSVSPDDSPIALPDHDFFLWLIYKSLNDVEITDDITIESLDNARNQDPRSRGAAFNRGIDGDRREVMSLLMNPKSKFGPVKMLLRDDSIGYLVEFELFLDGGFSITQGPSGYDDEEIDAKKRLYGVLDLAHHVVPELRKAHEAHTTWTSKDRTAFREACFAVASAPLTGGFAN